MQNRMMPKETMLDGLETTSRASQPLIVKEETKSEQKDQKGKSNKKRNKKQKQSNEKN